MRISIFILLLCLCIFRVKAQVFFKIDSNQKRVSIPFQLVRNMIVVPIMINNKGPYNFVLDTGVGLMIITDPKLVDSLNIKNKRSITVTGMGEGKDFEAYVVPSLRVNLPGITGETVSAAILKKDEFGLSNYAGTPIHGLLGYEFFSSFTVRINFSDTTIVAGLSTNMRLFKRGDKLPLTIEEHKPYITTRIRIGKEEKKDNKLILDLGAGHPLSLENLVDQNHGLPEKFIASNLGVSLTGPIKGFLSRVSELEMGKYKIKNIITSFPEYDTTKNKLIASVKRDGNIGADLLKKFNLIIDYQNGWLYLKPNDFYNEPFERDMSGIEYYADGPGYKHIMISNIEKGSAAADIGLQRGDEITRINLKPVSELSIGQIDNIFRSRDDRSILLQIFHDKQYDNVILVLKRRI